MRRRPSTRLAVAALAVAALVLAAAGCGRPEPPAGPLVTTLSLAATEAARRGTIELSATEIESLPRSQAREDSPPDDVVAMPWELIAVDADDRSVVIRYLPSVVCHRAAGIWARPDDDGVLIAPLARAPGSATACSLEAQPVVTTVVELPISIGERELRALLVDDELARRLDEEPLSAPS
ncbi:MULTISPECIES: hypothetical protein [Actinoalloteichus]|uniref:Uncharacterized protein n=1 Tax=Actinoalloteichus fjordicus TaxID=1612552 RepID=A0AAC9LH53_9PSEU|nr:MULTISPECIES: hypothetical protein [Actinoalloteichus]APU16794.1 hypothetical protein UA74_23880 [Actinoalloteichus fjordicus]APU22859.1 hypothetical protein UA75_24385 [Actinoalloteichus sp. GBA129-24]